MSAPKRYQDFVDLVIDALEKEYVHTVQVDISAPRVDHADIVDNEMDRLEDFEIESESESSPINGGAAEISPEGEK